MTIKKAYTELAVLLIVLIIAFAVLPARVAIFLNNKATQYQQAGDYQKAISFYEKSVMFYPKAETFYNLGTLYEQAEKTDKALLAFKNALNMDPQMKIAQDAVIDIYVSRNEYEKAREFLEEAAREPKERDSGFKKIDQENAVVLFNQGIDFMRTEKLDQAERSFRQVLAIDREFAKAYVALGQIYFKQGRFRAAVLAYNHALKNGEEHAFIYNNLGIIMMLNEDFSGAISYLKKAHTLEPENIDITYALASTLRDDKQFDHAMKLYEQIIAVDPKFPFIYNDIGGIYKATGEFEKADTFFEKELRIVAENKSTDKNTLLRSAAAYHGLRENYKAKEMLDDIIRKFPDFREAYFIRSQVVHELGDDALAQNDASKAKELSQGKYASVHVHEENNKKIFEKIAGPTPEREPGEFVPNTIIILKNGAVIEGIIKSNTKNKVSVDVVVGDSFGTISFSKAKIESIKTAR